MNWWAFCGKVAVTLTLLAFGFGVAGESYGEGLDRSIAGMILFAVCVAVIVLVWR